MTDDEWILFNLLCNVVIEGMNARKVTERDMAFLRELLAQRADRPIDSIDLPKREQRD